MKDRLNNFDFLRLFLAMSVIFSHSYPLTRGSDASEPLFRITHGQTTAGGIAVGFFFIMSGYLITGSFFNSAGVLDYLGRRVRRIYPGFIASMLFGALAIVPLAGGELTSGHGIVNVILHSLRLREFNAVHVFSQNPFPNVVNGSVWTIFYEFSCYIGVLILGVTGVLSVRKVVTGLFFIAIIASIALKAWDLHAPIFWLSIDFGVPSLRAQLIPAYLAGVAAYLYRDRIRYTWKGVVVCFFALLASCFVPFSWAGVFPVAGAYILFAAAFHPSIRLHQAAKFGDFSYGTYLYAFPLQQMIVRTWAEPMNPFLLFVLATPPALICGVVSWHLVERPFLNMGTTRRIRGMKDTIFARRQTAQTDRLPHPPFRRLR